MKLAYQYDINGFYVEDLILSDNATIPSNCTNIKPPDGLFKGQFTNGAWIEGKAQTDILTGLKVAKKTQLQQSFQVSLLNGFTSNADGTSRTYAIDPVAMGKWVGALAVINSGKGTASMTIKDFNGNKVTLTSAQFQQMAADGFTFFNAQEQHLWDLEDNVDTATINTINAINW